MKDSWRTPQLLFRRIQREMGITFTLDPCTTENNPLRTPKFFTKKENGLLQSWKQEIVYMNPPYSRNNIDKWVAKAKHEAQAHYGTVVVALLPLRTAQWFRKNILPGFKIIRDLEKWRYELDHSDCGVFFLEKRVKFIDPEIGAAIKGSPNFDSILAIWV